MTENKTRQTNASVAVFLDGIGDAQKRADCRALSKMMRSATGKSARMWGSSIVGFGTYDYRYASGRGGSSMVCGYAPRARNIALYIMAGFDRFKPLMNRLGRYKTGKSCLYLRRLADVDRDVLQQLIDGSVKYMRDNYHTY
jgi:hypothetical protein